MYTIDLLTSLTRHLEKYRNYALHSIIQNSHLTHIHKGEEPTKEQVDGVLVDFINYLGAMGGVDYGLTVDDLQPTNTNNIGNNYIFYYLAVDEDGLEYIFNCKPIRERTAFGIWVGSRLDFSKKSLPQGTIEKITGKKITWNDEPIKI